MRIFFLRVGWVLVLAVAGAFFLPWIKLQVAAFNRVVERQHLVGALTGEAERPWYIRYFLLPGFERRAALSEPLRGESGLELVQLAHSGNALKQQKARLTFEAFGLHRNAVPTGSALVYAGPALALLAMACFTLGARIPVLILGLLSVGYYFLVRWGIDESFLDRTVLGVNVGLGLWATVYAVGLLGLLLLLSLVTPAGKR